MRERLLTGAAERELDRRQFLKAAGAAAVLGAAGVLGSSLLPGCAPAKAPGAGPPAASRRIRMVGATIGGESTTMVMAYGALMNKYYPEIEWSSSSGPGSAVNAIYVTKGTTQMAGVTPPGFLDSYGADKVPESRLRGISMKTPSNYLWVIPEDKPWTDLTQVPRGTTVCPGNPGGAPVIAAETWLKACGLTKDYFNWVPLGKTEMSDGWRAGKIDVAMQTVAAASPSLMDMWTSARKLKPMGLSPEQVAKAKREQTFELAGFEPLAQSTITQLAPEVFKNDVFCTFATNALGVRDDFPEEIAYKMAKVIDEHYAELVQLYPGVRFGAKPEYHIRWARPPIAIHPGVAKYYKEKGYLK